MSTPGNLNITMTRANAIIYITRALGGAANSAITDMAEECLLRGFNDWQNEKDWEFLLKDVSNSFTVDSCVTAIGSPTISAPASAAFDGINIGITVTGTGIPASTTVSSYTRNTDGTVATITLSANATANGTVTLTFGGTIPVIANVQDYNLPTDFFRHYGVRLTNPVKWPLEFIRPRNWNRVTLSQTVTGPPSLYTIFNAQSNLTQNRGTYRLRLYPIPGANDIIQLEYYRRLNVNSDPLDMEGTQLYKFLDYCRGLLITTKRGFDQPDLAIANAEHALLKAKAKDEEATEDEDVRMKSQIETGGNINRPLWQNGPFLPDYGW